MSNYIAYFFLGLWLLAIIMLLGKPIKNKFSPAKTVKAVVVDKYIVETFSKYAGDGKREKYAVSFSAEGRTKTFYVMDFSYNGYTVGETGTLTYKGDQLISFT